jgi:hypothetical protein
MKLPTGLLGHFAEGAQFVGWLAADHLYQAPASEISAVIFHELLHAGIDIDTGKPNIIPHDYEVFTAEIRSMEQSSPICRGLKL